VNRTVVFLGISMLLLVAGAALAQDEFISYKLDGKAVRLTEVKLEWNSDDYITIEGVAKEKVDFGENAYPRMREAEAGITFQLAPEEDTYVGTRKATSSDTLPVYLNWYQVGKEEGFVKIDTHMADMDSSFEGQFFTVTVENFGDEGTLVKGTFSGMLKGDDDKLHAVEEGTFALRRKNVQN
jgi:hypothetical protein